MRKTVPGHTPPVLDHNGFERNGLRFSAGITNRKVDRLHDVQMPQNWQTTPRFSTRSELQQTRAAQLRPHASFDVDGDGFVGQSDYSISKKYDFNSGMFSGGQRDSAIAETCRILGSRLHDDEIGGNAKARRVLTSLREKPELSDDTVREARMRVGQMCVSTLKNKSSHQLKECMRFPEAYVPEPGAPVYTYTRTMLHANRRVEREQTEKDNHDRFMATTIFHPEP